MGTTSSRMGPSSWRCRWGGAGLAVVVGAITLSGVVPATAGAAGTSSTIPQSAFSTHIGITANSVTVGNVSTHEITLFTGAAVGTEAYADYINAKGGVNGRKIVVTAGDDKLSGTINQQLVQADMSKDFALVGSFSITATSGGQVLAKNPGMPDVSVTVSPANNRLPNLVSPVPLQGGWQEGSLLWFKQKNPTGVLKTGVMVADEPAAVDAWEGQEATMKHLGYKIAYENTFSESATYDTFVADVVAMEHAGVKMLFIEQNPPLYAAPLIKALNAEHFKPMVVLGASTYSDTLITKSGGPSAVDGMYLEQNLSMYLGTDSKVIPAVTTFQHWVQVADPGWKPDLFTMYGWLSGELFAQALQNAGQDPSRGSLLQALSKVTNFTGGNLTAPTNPAKKTISNCYLLGQIKDGQWTRLTDPPVDSSTHGYRCTDQYYVPPGTAY
jgi:branched-chain amino acid transport system substrate-binding protein